MSELSPAARALLSEGLRSDGPSDARRERGKARFMAAIGSGTLALGGAASAASVVTPAVASGAAGFVKSLGIGTLLLWFGTGAALGVGASGAVAVVARHAPEHEGSVPASLRMSAGVSPSAHPAEPERGFDRRRESSVAPAAPDTGAPPPASRREVVPSERASRAAAVGENGDVGPVRSAPSSPASASTLSEEAALLQRAERALAAHQPAAALAILAEHETHFARGALREEREAAKVLALCGLGRVDEARRFARAFVNAAPHSVLVPRLEHSCAAPY